MDIIKVKVKPGINKFVLINNTGVYSIIVRVPDKKQDSEKPKT